MLRAIIVGKGKTVYFLTKQFASKGYHSTIICPDADEARMLSRQLKATVLCGDGSQPETQESAGARRAQVFVALLPKDEDNLIACQVAHQVYGIPRTIALINDPDNENIFRELGISVAVSATQMLVHLIESQAGFEEITNLMFLGQGRVNVAEVILLADAPAIGQTLAELNLPPNSLIAAIIRGEDMLVPSGADRLKNFDRLVVVSDPEHHGAVLRALTGDEA